MDRYGLLRPIRHGYGLLKRSPMQFWKEIWEDFQNDRKADSSSKNPILCLGLPKSGTTLIENILVMMGAVNANCSVLRRASYLPETEHHHGICENYFKYLPETKYTFWKTHTHFDEKYINILESYSVKYFVSIRDIRSMMLSRYHHVLSEF